MISEISRNTFVSMFEANLRGEDFTSSDEHFMRLALAEAELAAGKGEVPVGAVIVAPDGETVIARGHNQPITTHDPTAHAEVVAIRAAAQALQNYRLDGCSLFVTLEPCTQCVGALVHARLKRVVFAASEPKAGSLQSARQLMAPESGYFNHRFVWQGGVLSAEAKAQLQAFFKTRRSSLAVSVAQRPDDERPLI